MILLTKAHLLFMADYAWLSFRDAGITCGFFSQPVVFVREPSARNFARSDRRTI